MIMIHFGRGIKEVPDATLATSKFDSVERSHAESFCCSPEESSQVSDSAMMNVLLAACITLLACAITVDAVGCNKFCCKAFQEIEQSVN